MLKFKTEKYNNRITPVECVRETASSVVVLESSLMLAATKRPPEERRHRKESEYEQYHDTWEDAHAFLMARADDKLRWARDALQKAQSEYGNVKGMKPERT